MATYKRTKRAIARLSEACTWAEVTATCLVTAAGQHNDKDRYWVDLFEHTIGRIVELADAVECEFNGLAHKD